MYTNRPHQMRVAWLPDAEHSDTLARELLELADDIELHPCTDIEQIMELLEGYMDVVLVPASLHPAELSELFDGGACVLAYDPHCSIDKEQQWLDAGAAGLVETDDPRRLLRSLIRAQRLHQRHATRHVDPTTGLPNQAALCERYAAGPTLGVKRGIILLDLTSADEIETYGEEVRTAVMATLANRMRTHFGTRAWLAQVGAHEFAAMLHPAPSETRMRTTATDLSRALSAHIALDNCAITPRVRVASLTSETATGAEMLREARATYPLTRGQDGQQIGRAGIQGLANVSRSRLGADFDRAMSDGEFALHYQPIVEFTSGKILGFEALARWNHQDRGLIPPSHFVPLAEHSGFIVELGSWVLHEACRQLRAWHDTVPELASCSMNVNLSPRQLLEPKLVHTVAQAIEYSGLAPESLRLELTENRALTDVTTEVARMHALRALGVEIHIDDFGSGFAQLGYLARLPVDVLKIDRSLVSGLQGSRRKRHIVDGVVDLARRLEIGLVAEGVETLAELTCLEQAGLTIGQGYLFSGPVAAERVPDFAGRVLRTATA